MFIVVKGKNNSYLHHNYLNRNLIFINLQKTNIKFCNGFNIYFLIIIRFLYVTNLAHSITNSRLIQTHYFLTLHHHLLLIILLGVWKQDGHISFHYRSLIRGLPMGSLNMTSRVSVFTFTYRIQFSTV